MKTSLTRHLILQLLVNVPPYHSHFLRQNFAHISEHTFSASHSHLNLLSCSDWPHRSLHLQRCKPCIARRGIYQVTSVSCFYGRHINFKFTLPYYTLLIYIYIYIIYVIYIYIYIYMHKLLQAAASLPLVSYIVLIMEEIAFFYITLLFPKGILFSYFFSLNYSLLLLLFLFFFIYFLAEVIAHRCQALSHSMQDIYLASTV